MILRASAVDPQDDDAHLLARLHHLGRVVDARPAHLADGQQAVGPADVHERAERLDRADGPLVDLALGQRLPQLLAARLALLLEQGAAADEEVLVLAIDLGDEAAHLRVRVDVQVFDAEQLDLADRHEAADAVDIDLQAALVGAGDLRLDEHADGDDRPVGLDRRALARQDEQAVGVVALDVDLEFGADGRAGRPRTSGCS